MDDTSINNEVTEAEENIINMFLSNNTNNNGTINLSDLIFEKLNQKNNNATLMNNTFSENMNNTNDDNNLDSMTNNQLPIKIITVYTSVGKLLHHYKTGKLPKALKMLPYLKNWEEILWLTRPDQWSPSATYACTRIFVSNLNDKMTQRYYNLVLLEKCRDDIRHNDKLNFYMYMSLKKALFKPAAFYKGILLPLVKSMTCTLREAIIFGSVIAKVSIASNHSAAVLIKLSEMEYCGSTSVFIKILLNKKYSFPMKVIDSMINHFLSFMDEERQLPVSYNNFYNYYCNFILLVLTLLLLVYVDYESIVHCTFLIICIINRLFGISLYLYLYKDTENRLMKVQRILSKHC